MAFKPPPKPKQKHRKGLWSPDEDERLRNYVLKHGHGCWSSVPINTGLQRNGKSCRLRWINYLRPGLKRGAFTAQEEETILSFHRMLGNKWSQIAQHLPGRTDNEIKNYWHSYLKKSEAAKAYQDSSLSPSSSSSSAVAQAQKISMTPPDDSNKTRESSLLTPSPEMVPAADGRQGQRSSSVLPRILFAEWLSLDEDHHQPVESANAVAPSLSNHQDLDLMDYRLCMGGHGGGSGGGDYAKNGELMISSNLASGRSDIHECSQLKLEMEDQMISGGGLMFLDYFPGENMIYSQFNSMDSNDVNALIYT